MAGRNLYGQPAPQAPPAPIPNKPTPPAAHHSPYGGPQGYPSSSGFDDQPYGLGRFGDNKAGGAPQGAGATQGQQTPQPIGASYPGQQGLHNFLGGSGSTGSAQPNRPQAGTPDDGFNKNQTGASNTSAPGGASAGARNQPNQPQQQAFASYPYGGYQNHDWSPYGQQHYSGSRNGGYSGWQQ